MLWLSVVGYVISLGNVLQGKPQPVNITDYPKFYQKMVIKNAAKEAGERQNAVVREFKLAQYKEA